MLHLSRRVTSVAVAASLVLVGPVLVGAGSASAATAPSGVDVASWQHPSGAAINWTSVRSAGKTFAFIKATESTTYTNPYFATDRSRARTAGLDVGAYHFARPTTAAGSAAAQARHFVAVTGAGRVAGDLPPVLDLEAGGSLAPAALVRWAGQWLTTVKALTGRTPIVYTYPAFYTSNLARTTALRAYPLWIANYTSASAPSSAYTAGWSTWTFWQWSATGRVSGISGAVDLNRFNGTQATLDALAGRTASGAGVRASVTIALSSSRTTRGHSVTMTGKVSPAHAGDVVIRQGYYSGAWHTWATTTTTSTGSYSFTITPKAIAVNHYRVLVPATARHAAAVSVTLDLTVR